MAEPKKYNNFSSKLLDELPMLKPKEKIRFQLTGVHIDKITKKLVCPKSKNVPKVDRIWDPWAKKRIGKAGGGYDGDYVDITLVIQELPAPQDSLRDTITVHGRIEFNNTFAGIIEITGGNKAQEAMLPMLFFCNRNASNVGKPWYIKPPGPALYQQLKVQEKAKATLSKEMKIDQAKAIITAFSEEEVHAAVSGLFPHKYATMSKEERILALRALAQTNADKILDLSKDVEVQTTALIEEFLKAHLIKIDQAKGQVKWVDDDTVICIIKPGQTPHQSLKHYFMSDLGVEVLESLEKQLTLSKSSIKDKTENAVV